MITGDVVFLIAILVALLLGVLVGFGKGLKFVTGGTIGKIISVVVCYFLFGVVLNWSFVQVWLNWFTNLLANDGSWICNALLSIRIDLIAFAVVLFIVVQILRRIIVAIISGVLSIKKPVIKAINRFLGVILFIAFFAMIALIVFQIAMWTSGTENGIYKAIEGSIFGLDKVYLGNPINSVFQNTGFVPPAETVEEEGAFVRLINIA